MKVSVDELEQLELSATFEFPSDFGKNTTSALNGFVMWFSCFYVGDEQKRREKVSGYHHLEEDSATTSSSSLSSFLELPTSPLTKPTHWKQTVIMLSDEGVPAEDIAGDTMTAKFTLVRDQRVYEIGLELE